MVHILTCLGLPDSIFSTNISFFSQIGALQASVSSAYEIVLKSSYFRHIFYKESKPDRLTKKQKNRLTEKNVIEGKNMRSDRMGQDTRL